MKIYKTSKALLVLRNNAGQLLSGLSSNTQDAPKNAFLTVHGRIIATFDQIKTAEDEFSIVIERAYLKNVEEHLDRYLKLNKTILEIKEAIVYYDCEGNVPVEPLDLVIPQKAGRLIATNRPLIETVTSDEFTQFRLNAGLPVHGIDYTNELLLNVDEYEFVSYIKGCFLGQEPIAKVHNRSKPTWKLVVRYKDECSLEEQGKMTSQVMDPATQRIQGFVFVANT